MNPAWVVALRDDVSLSSADGRALTVGGPFGETVLRRLPEGLRPVIEPLSPPGAPYGRLIGLAQRAGIPNAPAKLIYYLQLLARRGFLVLAAESAGRRLASLEATADSFQWPKETPLTGRYVLSRFAFLRRSGECAVLESPLSKARVVLRDDRAASLVFALSTPASLECVGKRVRALSADECAQVLGLLAAAGMLATVDEAGESEQTSRRDLQTWEFHDLLFHTRSRYGRTDAPLGATFPFAGTTGPPPAIEPPPTTAESVDLFRPDLNAAMRADPPFADVLENRRSLRKYGEQPLTAKQLGEFLYRVGRVRDEFEWDVETPAGIVPMQFTSRPYPSGGAMYELEIYPVVQHCRDLNAGLYRYDALGHRLHRLSEWSPSVEQLIVDAGLAADIPSVSIQVLLTISARYPRVAWKYASVSYALILKNVGVLYQTMYLTAEAMKLAPCALGSGDSDVFAKSIGGDYYAETSVGEFLLGSR
ncbi:MAG: SagB family peptide dehydrogenase [Planctomycetaceae bacterium]